MSVSKFNSEGYYDPVMYEALTKVEAEERAARAAAAYRWYRIYYFHSL